MSMRQRVERQEIEQFLVQVGRTRQPERLYLVGGAALVHRGIRPGQTLDFRSNEANILSNFTVDESLRQREISERRAIKKKEKPESAALLVSEGVIMSKRSTSQQVPKDMQVRFDEITQLTDVFGQEYLNDEYVSLCRQLTATLCRKRPSPLNQGKAATWACGIIHALGMVNFLFDASQTPHVLSSQIANAFDLSSSTMQAKSKHIRDLLGMHQMDPDWTLPSMIDKNPLVWMLEVNGFVMDVRHAPRAIQEEAFRKGLIPYIPAD